MYGVVNYVKTPEIFFDVHGLFFIVGATLAAGLVAYPYSSLARTFDYLLWGLILKKNKDYLKVSQEIAASRNAFFNSQNYMASEDAHPFFKESAMFLMNRNIDDSALKDVLRNRSDYFKKRYEEDAGVLKAMAKYPVSFGYISAVVSLLAVVPQMQSHPAEVISILFHGAALALSSIFWGLAIANFLILPVADSALKAADEDSMLRSLIIDGMVLIRTRATDDHFQAYLRGYLSLADRSEFKIFSKAIPFSVVPIQKKVEAVGTPEPAPVVFQSRVTTVAPVVAAVPPVAEANPTTNEETMPSISIAVENAIPALVPGSKGHVEASIKVTPDNVSNLTDMDFKDLKSLLRQDSKTGRVKSKYR